MKRIRWAMVAFSAALSLTPSCHEEWETTMKTLSRSDLCSRTCPDGGLCRSTSLDCDYFCGAKVDACVVDRETVEATGESSGPQSEPCATEYLPRAIQDGGIVVVLRCEVQVERPGCGKWDVAPALDH
jgi:hypothetical protein